MSDTIPDNQTIKEALQALEMAVDMVSDEKLKENKKKIEAPFDKLQKITGYTFDWKKDNPFHRCKGEDTGVMAQEVNGILPKIVQERRDGYKIVNYYKLIPLLIECIKEQQIQINELMK